MTATQTQLRRDTATNLNAAVPAAGEGGWNTTEKRLVVGDGSTQGGIPCVMAHDQQRQKFIYPAVSGTADEIILTNSFPISGYGNSLTLNFKAASNNTGAVTVDVDSKGEEDVKKMVAGVKTALAAGDIYAGGIYQLFHDGTDFIIKLDPPANSAGLVLLSIQTASASAALNFTSVITSNYSSYFFELDNLRPGTNSVSLLMQTSTNNGSAYDGAGGDYAWSFWHNTPGTFSTIDSATASALTTAIELGTYNVAGFRVGNGASDGISGKVELYAPLNATQFKRVSFNTGYTFNTTSPRMAHGVGFRLNTADIDAVRFLFSSGVITSGSIRCYGLKAS